MAAKTYLLAAVLISVYIGAAALAVWLFGGDLYEALAVIAIVAISLERARNYYG